MISQWVSQEVTAEKKGSRSRPARALFGALFSLERRILTRNRGIPAFFLRCRLVWVIGYGSGAEVIFGGSAKVKVTLTGRSANRDMQILK